MTFNSESEALAFTESKLKEIKEIVFENYKNYSAFTNSKAFDIRKDLIRGDSDWNVDYCSNVIILQAKVNTELTETLLYVPQIRIDMSMAHLKDTYEDTLNNAKRRGDTETIDLITKKLNDTPPVHVYAKAAKQYPIGFDYEGDKVEIIHSLYYGSKNLESKNIFRKIKGFLTIMKCKLLFKLDYRHSYSLQFNLPINKL